MTPETEDRENEFEYFPQSSRQISYIVSQLQLKAALLAKDVETIKETIVEIKTDLKSIKAYFLRAFIGIGGIVGLYFILWILNGGLAEVIKLS